MHTADNRQSKRDLGFIEGDLIECLNAGDGSWWTGRLRRDRRAVGLFPSNFVQVLDESYQPAPISRNASPLTLDNKPALNHQKSSTFRKPFQAYEKVGPKGSGAAQGGAEQEKKPKSKWTPYSSMKTAQPPGGASKKQASSSPVKEEPQFRIPSPPPRATERMKSRPTSPNPMAISRAASPNPMHPSNYYNLPRATSPAPNHFRAASPNPNGHYRAHSPNPQQQYRAHSPNPEQQYRSHSPNPQQQYRPHSPNPHQDYRSHSPDPYGDYREPSPVQYQEYHDSRAPSPQPWKMDAHPSQAPSPLPFNGEMASPPPPAPPPHRHVYQASRAPSPGPFTGDRGEYEADGSNSPAAHSQGMTPSPLRDAMADVMSSLHDMSMIGRSPSPQPPIPTDVWSPEAFNQLRSTNSSPIRPPRHNMHRDTYDSPRHETQDDNESQPSLPSSTRDEPPILGNYVQRMEHRLRHTRSAAGDYVRSTDDIESVSDHPPLQPASRPGTSSSRHASELGSKYGSQRQKLAHRKSAYEIGQLKRTSTTRTNTTISSSGWRSNATSTSNATQSTAHTIMSTSSAGAVSATSAGSMARRKFGMGSMRGKRPLSVLSSRSIGDMHDEYDRNRPISPVSGPSYHSSHATNPVLPTPTADWTTNPMESSGILGGLSAPKAKKSGFFKKMIATAKTTAKTGAADFRSTISSSGNSRPSSRVGPVTRVRAMPDGITAISSDPDLGLASAAHRDMGLGGGSDWMQVRRDVNRSNSLSRNERNERAERCQMLDITVINPIDELMEQVEGDESLDGLPITEPTDFNIPSLALVDKSTRFVSTIPPTITATALAQSYLCRQYRSDVQRLRAIFTWVAERITWEEDFEGQIDTRRVIQTKRGCSEEIAVLVRDMCAAVGLHSEIVRGYLKAPGEVLDLDTISQSNHWWNTVIVDGEWRIMDCSLASPTNPKRGMYSSASNSVAETFYFLTRPLEICYTHVPLLPEQQHICPPVAHEVLMALPCACPPYFRHKVELTDFDTSMLHLENLEMAHLKMVVPEDVECVAEVEARAFAHDPEGDLFESGDVVKKSAFAQAQWIGGRKVFTIKAVLPGDEGQGVLKIYAGKRGLMHSIKDNPHALAVGLPLSHTGQNPSFDFLIRHPTPHAQRHDLYVVQPQCRRLVINNTFVFCIRQHPSSLSRFSPDTWGSSSGAPSGRASALGHRPVSPNPNPYTRPASAMSMVSASASQSGSNYSDGNNNGTGMTDRQTKPAKLAIQSPSGKIIRLTRKNEYATSRSSPDVEDEGFASSWETVIKVGERGTWRGLVLADRSARWCVFGEWECI
ncbi:hypothetical protein MBLNU457_6946t2 [Dothideomycetes sp. NU457]